MSITRFDWEIVFGAIFILLIMLVLDTQARPAMTVVTSNVRQGTMKGKVIKIEAESSRVTLQHEPVPALEMDAMTMPFRVKNVSDLSHLKTGDFVIAEVFEEQDTGRMWLEDLRKYSPPQVARNKKAMRR